MIDLGIDVGAVSVKVAALGTSEDRDLFDGVRRQSGAFFSLDDGAPGFSPDRPILVSSYRRIKGEPVRATLDLLEALYRLVPGDRVASIRVTGIGGARIGELLNVGVENEFRAVARGVGMLHPEVRTVFEMGGDSSKYLRIHADPEQRTVGILDYERNGDCAAGTGSFMDQQASRLRYEIEAVGDIVMSAGRPATIAGRCSVFAKSDMVHAQQKGYGPPEILKGLCEAVVRNFKSAITKGKKIVPEVAFIGGVAANKGMVQAMRTVFELGEADLFVPPYYAWMGAIGAALLASESAEKSGPRGVEGLKSYIAREMVKFPRSAPLSMEKVILLRDRIRPYSFDGKKLPVDAYLGIDIGSVSTNLAVLDEAGDVIKDIYVMTESRPIEVVNRGLEEIWEGLGDKIVIRGVGTTGSGRELIGELVGADTVNDEITAHKTGASTIARKLVGSSVDTIFEIGGQDSKFISIQDDVVVDFAMNEACAAGTGSFLEEQAEKLGIRIKGEFSELALRSDSPIRLGERCTVFMEKDITPYLQKGARREDLVAGLAYSIVLNYLNRVVRGRKIGDVVYFQGGTAYNDAVAAAFSTVLGKEIIVPPHNGVVGAIGAALLAKEKALESGRETTFRGYSLKAVNYRIRGFTCKGCSNFCDVQEVCIEEQRTYWGDKCSDRYRKRAKVDKKPVIPDLMRLRERLLLEAYEEGREGIRIGLPRGMYFYEQFPFWNAFLREVGFGVAISDPTNKKIATEGLEATVAEPCFPIRVAHGHVRDLLEKGVDFILQPNVINGETPFRETESHLCPWGQTLPFVLRSAPVLSAHWDKILCPTVHFRDGREAVARELGTFVKPFGISRRVVRRAVSAAYEAQRDFFGRLNEAGREALGAIQEAGDLGVVLVGRPYNVNDPGVNMNIPNKLRDTYGVNVIPMDALLSDELDISDVNDNMYWNYGRKIIQVCKIVAQHPELHILYVTNFKCGPDSYIKHFVRDASGKPYLSLQFDEHSNDAGVLTRCEAYLDSKGFLRWWKRGKAA